MTNLDRTWKNCLRMWKWIAEVYDDGVENVVELKKQWVTKHKFKKDIFANCFFCEYVNSKNIDCDDCPGALVDSSFNCTNNDYNYEYDPKAFFAEIFRLNVIRTKGK